MVDESGVEGVAEGATGTFAAFGRTGKFRRFDWSADVKHPQLGMVTMQFEACFVVDSRRSIQEQEADLRAIVQRGLADIESAARTA